MKMRIVKDFKKGFTLIELSVVLFIFLLLLGAIFTILATSRSAWQVGSIQIELQQELRKSLVWIAEELRQAGYSKLNGVPVDGAWYNTISFRKAEGVVGGEVSWSGEAIQYLRGGLNNRQLLRIVGNETKVLANSIISFQVRRQALNPEIVEVFLQADKNTISGFQIVETLDFRIKVRN